MTGLKFKSNGDGTCQLVVTENFTEEILEIPEKVLTVTRLSHFFCPLLLIEQFPSVWKNWRR